MDRRTCDDALRELYSFLDGALDDATRAAIRQHLDDCPPCAGAYSFEVELRQVIARSCHERVPDHLRTRVAELLRAEGVDLPPAR